MTNQRYFFICCTPGRSAMENSVYIFISGLILPFILLPIIAFIMIKYRFYKNTKSFWNSQSVRALELAGIHSENNIPACPAILTDLECSQTALQVLAVAHELGLLEALLNTDKPGPLWTAHWSLAVSVLTHGRQFRYNELCDILKNSNFSNITQSPLIGYFSTIQATKPV